MKFNLRGLLQDEEFLVAAGLLSAGSQGQNIGQAAFPALLQAGKTASFFDTAQAKRNKNEALEKLLSSDQVSDIDKLYIAAGVTPPKRTNKNIKYDTMFSAEGKKFDVDLSDPSSSSIIKQKISEGYSFSKPDKSISKTKNFKTLFSPDGKDRIEVDLNNPEHENKIEFYLGNDYSFTKFDQLKKPKRTISDEALRIYDILKKAPNFDKAFESLNQAEKDIYTKQIKGNVSLLEQHLKDAMKNKSKKTSVDFSNYSFTVKGNKSGYTSVEEYINATKEKNPDASIEQIIQALIEQEIIIGG